MSHFHLGVILPIDIDSGKPRLVAAALRHMMAPYYEGLEVAPHRAPLPAEHLPGMRRMYNLPPDAPLNALAEHIQDFTGLPGGVDEHGLYVVTTYNPRARWDGYEIGARWCGVLTGRRCTGSSHSPDRIPAFHEAINLCQVRELRPGQGFHALLTPHSEWYEKGTMGAFGFVRDEKPQREWDAIRAEVLSAYPEHWAISLDCHI